MPKLDRTNLLDTEEAAELAGLSYGYMRNLRFMGRGPDYIRDRGRVYYRESVVQAWLAERRESAKGAGR